MFGNKKLVAELAELRGRYAELRGKYWKVSEELAELKQATKPEAQRRADIKVDSYRRVFVQGAASPKIQQGYRDALEKQALTNAGLNG